LKVKGTYMLLGTSKGFTDRKSFGHITQNQNAHCPQLLRKCWTCPNYLSTYTFLDELWTPLIELMLHAFTAGVLVVESFRAVLPWSNGFYSGRFAQNCVGHLQQWRSLIRSDLLGTSVTCHPRSFGRNVRSTIRKTTATQPGNFQQPTPLILHQGQWKFAHDFLHELIFPVIPTCFIPVGGILQFSFVD